MGTSPDAAHPYALDGGEALTLAATALLAVLCAWLLTAWIRRRQSRQLTKPWLVPMLCAVPAALVIALVPEIIALF
jgi:hypothetical protein